MAASLPVLLSVLLPLLVLVDADGGQVHHQHQHHHQQQHGNHQSQQLRHPLPQKQPFLAAADRRQRGLPPQQPLRPVQQQQLRSGGPQLKLQQQQRSFQQQQPKLPPVSPPHERQQRVLPSRPAQPPRRVPQQQPQGRIVNPRPQPAASKGPRKIQQTPLKLGPATGGNTKKQQQQRLENTFNAQPEESRSVEVKVAAPPTATPTVTSPPPASSTTAAAVLSPQSKAAAAEKPRKEKPAKKGGAEAAVVAKKPIKTVEEAFKAADRDYRVPSYSAPKFIIKQAGKFCLFFFFRGNHLFHQNIKRDNILRHHIFQRVLKSPSS
jgi:hypothetical protein